MKTPEEELAAEAEAAKKQQEEQERAEKARKDAEAAAKVAAEAAQKAERERVVVITELGTRHAAAGRVRAEADHRGQDGRPGARAVLDELAKKTDDGPLGPQRHRHDLGRDGQPPRRDGRALLHRADPAHKLRSGSRRGWATRCAS
jgi:hypothetical protein